MGGVVYTDLGEFIAAANKAQEAAGRPRRARDFWHPVLARVYGIMPWNVGALTLREWRLIVEDIEQTARAR